MKTRWLDRGIGFSMGLCLGVWSVIAVVERRDAARAAAEHAMHEQMHEQMNSPEVRAQIEKALGDAWKQVLDNPPDEHGVHKLTPEQDRKLDQRVRGAVGSARVLDGGTVEVENTWGSR